MQSQRATRSYFGIPLHHWLIVLVLVAFGISSRFIWVDVPNFKPVVAIALFCGFYFPRRWIGIATATVILLASDFAIGFYQLPIMISVYGSILIACMLGFLIRRRIHESNSVLTRFAMFSGTAIVMSLLFFLVTNAAVVLAGWYPLSLNGLAASYLAGLPFFKYTLMGDVCFTSGIFSIYLLSQQLDLSALAWRRAKRATKFAR